MRIAVAMSGGVDSSVAALMLAREGHDVVGVTMDITPTDTPRGSCEEEAPNCSGAAATRDARRVAAELGVPHEVLPMRHAFERAVIEHFVSEYARGRTPNPCVRCNQLVKFRGLIAAAEAMGVHRLATGHHAVVRETPCGSVLARAADSTKDQTYFLFRLTRRDLDRVVMPVGQLTKARVRELARGAGLHVAERPESQDACFVPGGDVEQFLRERAPGATKPGPILDMNGRALGEHRGIGLYTVGQRSGLGLSRSKPGYVVRIDASRNEIVVGDEEDLHSDSLVADEFNWVAGSAPCGEFRALAKIRYASPPAACTVRLHDGGARVVFDEPQRAIAPGQAVVLYDGDVVLGGGTICGPG
jgi:tRNA-specific 2-thiouridylase